MRAAACSWQAGKAVDADWVEQKLRIRCDGAALGAEPSTKETCAGKADGVYCSTQTADVGYTCEGGVIGHREVQRRGEHLDDRPDLRRRVHRGAPDDLVVQCRPR